MLPKRCLGAVYSITHLQLYDIFALTTGTENRATPPLPRESALTIL